MRRVGVGDDFKGNQGAFVFVEQRVKLGASVLRDGRFVMRDSRVLVLAPS